LKDPNTGKSIKVFDIENDFQFKTYSIRSEADMILYRQDVVPTLREWGAEIYRMIIVKSEVHMCIGIKRATIKYCY
jgi:hypothetical protein